MELAFFHYTFVLTVFHGGIKIPGRRECASGWTGKELKPVSYVRGNSRRDLLGLLAFLTLGERGVLSQNLRRQTSVARSLVAEGQPTEIFIQPHALLISQWDWSVLVGVEENNSREPVLYTLGRDNRTERIRFAIPESGYILVHGISMGADQSLAVCGQGASSDERRGSFVALIAPDRSRQVVTRTWPYVAEVITLASDGTIWTVGWHTGEDEGKATRFNVVKRFSPTGSVLKSLAVSARAWARTSDGAALSIMKSSHDRVGWLTNGLEYIEFTAEGNEIGRYGGPPASQDYNKTSAGLALSESNEVVVGVLEERAFKVWTLDRGRRTWIPVQGQSGGRGWEKVLGFDGLDIVTIRHDFEKRRWLPRYRLKQLNEPPQ